MASIIGGIGTSHVPTIGVAFDKRKDDDPDWQPLFQGVVLLIAVSLGAFGLLRVRNKLDWFA